MCSLPLKSLLKSEALYLDEMLDVKDRSGALRPATQTTNYTGVYKRKSHWPIIGNLKVCVNHKTVKLPVFVRKCRSEWSAIVITEYHYTSIYWE